MFKQDFREYVYLQDTIDTRCQNDDRKSFDEMMRVFKIFAITDDEVEGLFTLLSIILMFGNIQFVQQADKSSLILP